MFAAPGGPAAYSALAGAAPPQGAYGSPPPPQQPQQQQQYGYGSMPPPAAAAAAYPYQMPMPSYPAAFPPPHHAAPPPPAPAAAAAFPGSPPTAQPTAYNNPTFVANPNNPFAAAGIPTIPSATSYGTAGALPTTASNNPFAAAPAPAPQPAPVAPTASVDAEWDMFFAGRTVPGAPAAGGAASQQQVHTDFEAMVAGRK